MPWPAEPDNLLASRGARRHLRALVTCDAVCDELPLVVDGSRRPNSAMAEHLQACLRCQAELSAYRRLLRALRNLRDDPAGVPAPALVSETLRALGGYRAPPGRRGPSRLLAGAVGALSVALAAVALAAAARQARPAASRPAV